MESRIPLPTDNIFKFYALFGLFLFAFAIGEGLYLTKSHNEFLMASVVEVEGLREVEKPSAAQKARKAVLERLMEVERTDNTFLGNLLVALATGAFFLMIYGFQQWHTKIQPLQDEISQLQLKKLRLEMEQLELPNVPPRKLKKR